MSREEIANLIGYEIEYGENGATVLYELQILPILVVEELYELINGGQDE